MTIMTINKFWQKADDILTIYRSKYRRAILTDDEQILNVVEFLSDMEALASEWWNRDSKNKENK